MSWARIERWFAANRPELDLGLLPPANAAQLDETERALGVALPADFRAAYLEHDGQLDEPRVHLLPHAQRTGSLASIVACWNEDAKYRDAEQLLERMTWLDRQERVRQVHLHPKRIAFAGSPHWDYDRLCLDYVPGPLGAEAQIIARADIDHVYVAPSFGVLLDAIGGGLEDGTVVLSPAYDGVLELLYVTPKTKASLPFHKWWAQREKKRR